MTHNSFTYTAPLQAVLRPYGLGAPYRAFRDVRASASLWIMKATVRSDSLPPRQEKKMTNAPRKKVPCGFGFQ